MAKHRAPDDEPGSLPGGTPIIGKPAPIPQPDESGEQRDGVAGPWS